MLNRPPVQRRIENTAISNAAGGLRQSLAQRGASVSLGSTAPFSFSTSNHDASVTGANYREYSLEQLCLMIQTGQHLKKTELVNVRKEIDRRVRNDRAGKIDVHMLADQYPACKAVLLAAHADTQAVREVRALSKVSVPYEFKDISNTDDEEQNDVDYYNNNNNNNDDTKNSNRESTESTAATNSAGGDTINDNNGANTELDEHNNNNNNPPKATTNRKKPPEKESIITRINTKRKQRHDAALSAFDTNMRGLVQQVETRFDFETTQIKKKLDQDQQDLVSLITNTGGNNSYNEDEEDHDNLTYPTVLTSTVETRLVARKSWQDDYARALSGIIGDLSSHIHREMERLTSQLADIAFLNEPELLILLNELGLSFNLSLVDYRATMEDVKTKIRIREIKVESAMRTLLQQRITDWTTQKHKKVSDRCVALISGTRFSDPPERRSTLEDYSKKQNRIKKILLDQLQGIKFLTVSSFATGMMTDWDASLRTLKENLQNINKEYISKLALNEKAKDAEAQREIDNTANVLIQLARLFRSMIKPKTETQQQQQQQQQGSLEGFTQLQQQAEEASIRQELNDRCKGIINNWESEGTKLVELFEAATRTQIEIMGQRSASIVKMFAGASDFVVNNIKDQLVKQEATIKQLLKDKREEHERILTDLQTKLNAEIEGIKRAPSDEETKASHARANELLDAIEEEYKRFARDSASLLQPYVEEVHQMLSKTEDTLLECLGLVDETKKPIPNPEEVVPAQLPAPAPTDSKKGGAKKGEKPQSNTATSTHAAGLTPAASPAPAPLIKVMGHITTSSGRELAVIRPVQAMSFALASPSSKNGAPAEVVNSTTTATSATATSPASATVESITLKIPTTTITTTTTGGDAPATPADIKPEALTKLKGLVAEFVDEAMITPEVFESILEHLRKGLVDFMETTAKSFIEKVDKFCDDTRTSLVLERKENLRLHQPLKPSLELEVHDARQREIVENKRGVMNHLQQISIKRENFIHKANGMLDKITTEYEKHIEEQVPWKEKLSTAAQIMTLEKFNRDLNLVNDTFKAKIQKDIDRLKQYIVDSIQSGIKEDNDKFRKRYLVSFDQKGKLSEDEIKKFEERLAEFDRELDARCVELLSKVDTAIKSLEDRLTAEQTNFQKAMQAHKLDLTLLKDLAAVHSTAKGKINIQITDSKTMAGDIEKELQELEAICERSSATTTTTTTTTTTNTKDPIPFKAIRLLDSLRRRFYTRSLYLACLENKRDLVKIQLNYETRQPRHVEDIKPEVESIKITDMKAQVSAIISQQKAESLPIIEKYYQTKGSEPPTRPNQIPPTLEAHKEKLNSTVEHMLEGVTAHIKDATRELRAQVMRMSLALSKLPHVIFTELSSLVRGKANGLIMEQQQQYSAKRESVLRERREFEKKLTPAMRNASRQAELFELDKQATEGSQMMTSMITEFANTCMSIETTCGHEFLTKAVVICEILFDILGNIIMPKDLTPGDDPVVGTHMGLKRLMKKQLKDKMQQQQQQQQQPPQQQQQQQQLASATNTKDKDSKQQQQQQHHPQDPNAMEWQGLPLVDMTIEKALASKGIALSGLSSSAEQQQQPKKPATPAATSKTKPGSGKNTTATSQQPATTSVTLRGANNHAFRAAIEARNTSYEQYYQRFYCNALVRIHEQRVKDLAAEEDWCTWKNKSVALLNTSVDASAVSTTTIATAANL